MDIVEQALGTALYTPGDTALDGGASLLAADPGRWPDVGAELLRRGAQLLRQAWERGWQPADVVRLVRRDLDDRHVRLAVDLVAAEGRRYTRVEPRWQSQLDALGAAGAWWGADVDYAPALAARESADRFTLATAHLELLRLLLSLPAVEPVGPVPGDPAHSAAPAAGEPRMLTRIRALLAKAEATDYPQEAEALSTKAQELAARHSIDEALLAVGGRSADSPAACRIGVDAPYETAKAVLLDTLASANRCQAVWSGELGFSTVVGYPADLESVEVLHASLLVQGTAAMTRAEAEQRAGGRKRTKTFRQAFWMAYASRLGDRLTEAAEHSADAHAESLGAADGTEGGAGRADASAGSLLPVLAARDAAVSDRTQQMFPGTTRTRVRGVSDAAGWAQGTAAADRARVGSGGRPLPPKG
ncbi:DUF2786 domain-containing protein [Streptomyces sp. 549]|uniref:DUF2786 domain-containing protein n=1 Tax=Streptomyces sp. 549 TaxID=3049076 RepID=UPI0024C28CB5|nr:DUF2786 domain-containing protein [Streptomyces sp. 549]MDK1473229.1 DUF2786 domain-containing protein [Streptomyces sp. 549]